MSAKKKKSYRDRVLATVGMGEAPLIVADIANILWPDGDGEHDCGADEIGEVCNLLMRAGLSPGSVR